MLERLKFEDSTFYIDIKGIDEDRIIEFFNDWGFKYNESIREINDELLLDGGIIERNNFFPFYNTSEDFWHAVEKNKIKPTKYHIINNNVDAKEFDKKVEYFFDIKSVLREICQVENTDGISNFIFFTTKESYLKRIEIKGGLTYENLVKLELTEENLKLAKKILDITKNSEDVHANERMHILRESLGDIFKIEENRNIFYLLNKVKDFYKEYTERYNLYVSKFSINKIISEIENERVGMICKIQDYLISQQTKSFAIPGASVAIMAIFRFAQNTFDYLVLYLAFLLSSWMICSMNAGAIKQISILLTEFNKTMSKYIDIEKGFEDINREIIKSKDDLSKLAENAESKIEMLTNVSILSCVFIFIVVIEKSELFTK